MLPIATSLVRAQMEGALALIERATEDGLHAASDDGERAETLRASALHARRLARA